MLQKLPKFIQLAHGVVPKNTTLPILACVCVEDGFVRATNLETTVRMPVDDQRKYTLSFGVLKSVMRSKPRELDIEILDDQRIKISYDGKHVIVKSLNPDDFPQMPKESFKTIGSWGKKIIKSLGCMIPFASKEELRPALRGIYVHLGEDLTFAATDGHVLREARVMNSGSGRKAGFKGIIPAVPLSSVVKYAGSSTEVAYSKNYIKFTLPSGIEIFIKLIKEEYPPYEEFVNGKKGSSVEFSKDEMISVIRDAKEFADRTTLRCELFPSNGSIEISTADHEREVRFESKVPARRRKGKSERTGFNLKYLEKVLKGISGEKIRWEYDESLKGSYFRGLTREDEGVTNLLMPIRLEG